MARSFRKSPVFGTLHPGASEKQDKRIANRAFRRIARHKLRPAQDFDSLVLPVMREVSNVWSFCHDGKRWRNNIIDANQQGSRFRIASMRK